MAITRQVSDYKDSVKAATTGANINLAAAPNTLDGVSLVVGDRVLVKDQTPNTLNGIYRVATLGTGSNGVWTRTGDFNDWRTITSGALTFVEQGAISGNIFYYIPGGEPNVTVGSTAITFANLYTLIDTTAPLQVVTNYGNITTNPITAASFTTSSGGQISGYLNGAIGANTANSGTFTSITTTGTSGNIVGSGTSYIVAGYLVANNNVYGNAYLWYNNNAPLATTITGTYSNSNVASYLPSYSGNLTAGNITTVSGGQLAGYFTGTIGANAANSATFTTATITNSLNTTGLGTGALVLTQGGASIQQDLYVGGNIYAANLISETSQTLVVSDPLIYLSANSGSYNYDIGFYSHFTGGNIGQYAHTGLTRNYLDNAWYLFSNVAPEPSGGVINLGYSGIVYDTLKLGAALIQNTTTASSTTSGALQVSGGVGIVGNAYVGGNVYTAGLYNLSGAAFSLPTKVTNSNTAPSSPSKGDQWYQANTDILYEYITDALSNSYWFDISTRGATTNAQVSYSAVYSNVYYYGNGSILGVNFTSSASAPISPNLGDRWYRTSNDVLYEYVQDSANNKLWLDVSSKSLPSATATFANLTVTGNASVGNITSSGQVVGYFNGAIGANGANSGTFTTLTANSNTSLNNYANLYIANGSTSSTSALTIVGNVYGQGGNGYLDFLKLQNTYSAATNPNKFFRVNSTGGVEIINSAYSNTIIQIQDSGDTTIAGNLTVSGSAGITMPNRPAFRVYGSGGTGISATTTLTSSNFTLDYQQGSGLNTSTGIFTAPVAGLYMITLIIRTNSNSNSSIGQALVRKTAAIGGATSTQIMVEFGPNTTMNHAGGSTIAKMALNDTLQTIVTSGTLNFDGNDNWSVAYIG